ncbi:MAG: plasmid pRiA4b ORF-3 family protein [Actinomycetota bacterium]|nr:plasmid pRiA4b ORF-3 family protein [Actinomycetota bacterium]
MTDTAETLILRISLDYVEPEIWRVVEVAGNGTLGDVHEALVGAMGWEDSHLHSFMVGDETYSPVYERLETIGDDEESITIDEALPDVGSTITWLYDWGDEWRHTITVEDTGTMQHGITYPVLYGGARACPPEDCGGPWGYMELLAILNDPDYEPQRLSREQSLNWLRPGFNPDVFHFKKAEWRMRNPAPKKPW